MKKFIIELKEYLDKAVSEVMNGSCNLRYEETDHGFFCDYDTEIPINPEIFAEISDKMRGNHISCAFEAESFSGVYEDDDSSKKMLQRIYITAFEDKAQFEEYKNFVREAEMCDHKHLGQKLKLFSSSNDIGQGLILWHPNGAMIRHMLEKFGQEAHILNDYQWVYSPHIGRADLWKTSGHLDFYRDSMYSPIDIDGEEYYLKPMNCPFHINIYNSQVRSYRELPMRLVEYGTVYRYELSGTLNGLTRVRGFTQDDSHIICEENQISDEVSNALKFSLYVLKAFGFEDFNAYISTKPEKKFIGDDEMWNSATDVLKNAVVSSGLEYKIDEGGGAFYGPKIDLKLKDSLGREWQCGTIQFDFNLPQRFNMGYIGRDGKKYTPMMIHRALFGSLERFTALLIEHYKGDFPFWLSPVQIGIVPINDEKHGNWARKLSIQLKKLGLRVSLNSDDGNMRSKIKDFEMHRVPYMLILGDSETESGTFSVRSRKHGNLGVFDVNQFEEYLKPEIEKGIPQYIYE